MCRCRIFIVDDHPLIRAGLSEEIDRQPDLEVCGLAASRASALHDIGTCHPDLAVIDLLLPDGSGLDLIEDIGHRFPGVRTLVLSMLDERSYAPRALAAGAKGYVGKESVAENILAAIRCVLRGNVWLSEAMRQRTVNNLARGGTPPSGLQTDLLSNRELEVYRLLGEGLRTKQIAHRMHLSIKTVATYYERIKVRLKLETFHDLERHAILSIQREPGRPALDPGVSPTE